MQLPKKILVPVDFSEDSRLAMKTAAAYARAWGARIDVLHVVAQPTYAGDMMVPILGGVRLGDFMEDEAQKELTQFVADTPEVSDVLGAALVRMGGPADRILKYAEEVEPDLLVMGTRGRSGLAHVLIGSVAERVLRHSRCPVLVVPHPRPPH